MGGPAQVKQWQCTAPEAAHLRQAFSQCASFSSVPSSQCLVVDSLPAGSQTAMELGMNSVFVGKQDAAPGERDCATLETQGACSKHTA